MALPVRGQADWDDELNNAVSAIEATAEAAAADANVARSNSIVALNEAAGAKQFVQAPTDGQVATLIGQSGSATESALSASITDATNLATRISYADKANGTAPVVADTGELIDNVFNATGRALVVNGGRLIHGTLPASGGYAAYAQIALTGTVKAKLIKQTFVQPSASATPTFVCLIAWGGIYEGGGTNVPSSRCHLVINPTAGTYEYGVFRGDGSALVVPKSGTYTPTAYGKEATVWALFDEDAGDTYLYLPDGSVVTVTAAQISAAFTAQSQTPVALRDLGGAVVTGELFATTGAETGTFAEICSIEGSQVLPVASRDTVSPQDFVRAIRSARAAIPPAASNVVLAPTTAVSAVTAAGAANVDTNAKVTATAGASGKVVIVVTAYYEWTASAELFWRVAGTSSSTSRVAMLGTTGDKRIVSQSIEVSGLTAGQTGTWTLQHFATTNVGGVTCKAGGTGTGTTYPPITMVAVPV